MKGRIIIYAKTSRVFLDVEYFDNPAAKSILKSCPIESKAEIWGQEVYFDIGVDAPINGLTVEVDAGDVAFWPEGRCLCLFFGPTPASRSIKPVPASEVVVVGRIVSGLGSLNLVSAGDKIEIPKL